MARIRLDALVTAVTRWSASARPDADRSALRDAGRTLAERPAFAPQAALMLGLAAAATAYSDTHSGRPAAIADAFDDVATIVRDQPIAAAAVADALPAAVVDNTAINPAIVLAAAALLATQEDVARGLFALALLATGRSLGWPEPWRVVLRTLRDHPAADVRARALSVNTGTG